MSDTELLDALERFIDNNGELVLNRSYAGRYPGLGLKMTSRTLRQAVQALTKPPAESAEMSDSNGPDSQKTRRKG